MIMLVVFMANSWGIKYTLSSLLFMEAESSEWQHLSKDNNKADGSRKTQNNNERVSVIYTAY